LNTIEKQAEENSTRSGFYQKKLQEGNQDEEEDQDQEEETKDSMVEDLNTSDPPDANYHSEEDPEQEEMKEHYELNPQDTGKPFHHLFYRTNHTQNYGWRLLEGMH
jgi:hypothetical protein